MTPEEFVYGKRVDKEDFSKEVVHYLDELGDNEFLGKTFLVRVDYNDQHWDERGELINDRRFKASLPTINHILTRQGKVVILTHQGRPEPGKITPEFSLERIAKAIATKLGRNVPHLKIDENNRPFQLVTQAVKDHIANMQSGDVCILDNSRFDQRDHSNNVLERTSLANDLASIADYFVLDGFPIVHREDTTVTQVPKHLRSFGGFWLREEIESHKHFAEMLTAEPRGKLVAIFAGIKADKLNLVKIFSNLMKEGDAIILAGALKDNLSDELRFEVESRGVEIILQEDSINGKDVGPATLKRFLEKLTEAELVFWNGPLGQFEIDTYAMGTSTIARQLEDQLAQNTTKIVFVSGGETSFAVSKSLRRLPPANEFVISTGGGASTAFFAKEGKIPGIIAISR